MIPIWVGKIVAKRVIKAIKYKIDLKKIDKYVKEDNELDLQVRAHAKALDKLKKDSHPPIFGEKDKEDIIKRLNKLEKRRK